LEIGTRSETRVDAIVSVQRQRTQPIDKRA